MSATSTLTSRCQRVGACAGSASPTGLMRNTHADYATSAPAPQEEPRCPVFAPFRRWSRPATSAPHNWRLGNAIASTTHPSSAPGAGWYLPVLVISASTLMATAIGAQGQRPSIVCTRITVLRLGTVVHCSMQTTACAFAINTTNKHQPWLDHDACGAKPLKGRGICVWPSSPGNLPRAPHADNTRARRENSRKPTMRPKSQCRQRGCEL
jgi:hypothetical protein